MVVFFRRKHLKEESFGRLSILECMEVEMQQERVCAECGNPLRAGAHATRKYCHDCNRKLNRERDTLYRRNWLARKRAAGENK